MWLTESNRHYHVLIGAISALVGTIIGAILVAAALEWKDCQGDANNQDIPPYSWTWRKWDWIDFLATILGGLLGQVVQIGVILLIV